MCVPVQLYMHIYIYIDTLDTPRHGLWFMAYAGLVGSAGLCPLVPSLSAADAQVPWKHGKIGRKPWNWGNPEWSVYTCLFGIIHLSMGLFGKIHLSMDDFIDDLGDTPIFFGHPHMRPMKVERHVHCQDDWYQRSPAAMFEKSAIWIGSSIQTSWNHAKDARSFKGEASPTVGNFTWFQSRCSFWRDHSKVHSVLIRDSLTSPEVTIPSACHGSGCIAWPCNCASAASPRCALELWTVPRSINSARNRGG